MVGNFRKGFFTNQEPFVKTKTMKFLLSMCKVNELHFNPSYLEFSQFYAAAYKLAMTRENIVFGFKKSGVYPLDRYAIAIPGEDPVKSPPHLHKQQLLYTQQ